MTGIKDIMIRVLNIVERVRNMEVVPGITMIIFGVILVFGIMNCILGYRLLRFWMMLGGFMLGVSLGFLGVHSMEIQDKYIYIGAMLAGGVVLAIVAFLIYKAGVFMLGAGIGWTVSIYIIHPMTSASFFLCILAGVGLGALGVRYCREVLIVATSLMGGIMAGLSLAKIGNLGEFPYGVAMSAAFALLGILIQFAINKPDEEDEEEDTEDSREEELQPEEIKEQEQMVSRRGGQDKS